MITPLTNGLLVNPVPLQLTLNLCSHGCIYCFSILNNPKRKADLKGIVSQLKNHNTRNDLVSYFLREKYPVLISNNVDPFSKNNYQLTSQIVDILNSYEIPIQLNTRGGFGWQEVTEKMKPSLIYVSVPYFDDEIRMKYEPNAPSLEDRFDMVKELVKRHKVMIGINPFDRAFCDDHKQIIDQYRAIGIKYFWINAFHLTYKQQANLTTNQKEILGEELLNHAARKNLFTPEWIENYIEVREYCKTVDCEIIGDPSGHFAGFEEDLYSIYDKLLPTQNDFFKWCEENKTDGDFIYFQEFFDFFNARLPQIEVNISPFIENKSNVGDQTFYKKTKLSNILHVYWDSKAGLKLPTYYPVFSWVKKQFPTKLDWIKDENGDRVMFYHPNSYNKKEFQILD